MKVMEPLYLKDISGMDLFIGDRCVMWRPEGLDIVNVLKYNESTNMIGVEIVRRVDGTWSRQKFSTPYDKGKFYKV